MLYAIPLFGDRVAPRCTIADEILIIRAVGGRIADKKNIIITEKDWPGILKILTEKRVDILVCGGINNEDKNIAKTKGINVIDNVACGIEEIFEAVKAHKLRPGYGFINEYDEPEPLNNNNDEYLYINCLNCNNKECLDGKECPFAVNINLPEYDEADSLKMDSVIDISLEEERKLCRLSELVYYALDMRYRKIGVAYCTDLSEAAEILVSVLKRFFDVYPVCCKIGGRQLSESYENNAKISCNPLAQAEVLNRMGSDLNIIVGLCIGSDTIFTKKSKAPVTTLFVKDKSLANNPIGALYSDYYLKEVAESSLE